MSDSALALALSPEALLPGRLISVFASGRRLCFFPVDRAVVVRPDREIAAAAGAARLGADEAVRSAVGCFRGEFGGWGVLAVVVVPA